MGEGRRAPIAIHICELQVLDFLCQNHGAVAEAAGTVIQKEAEVVANTIRHDAVDVTIVIDVGAHGVFIDLAREWRVRHLGEAARAVAKV